MDRLKEPSSWAGIAVLAGLIWPEAAPIVGEVAAQLGQAVGALAAAVAIIRRERARG